ncbi:hypothetical protein HI914_06633 [Erysiphe necator]|nr:hypothetical protein HI914_06633 [Erysiphe necator]
MLVLCDRIGWTRPIFYYKKKDGIYTCWITLREVKFITTKEHDNLHDAKEDVAEQAILFFD